MTDTTALAILQDGSRIPVSEPYERAMVLFRDGQYDMDEVIGIERSGEAEPIPTTSYPQTFTQEPMRL